MRNVRASFSVFLKFFYIDMPLCFNKEKLQFDFFILFLLKNTECHVSIEGLQKDTRRSSNIPRKTYLWYRTIGLSHYIRIFSKITKSIYHVPLAE
jgi:hypothetical protein